MRSIVLVLLSLVALPLHAGSAMAKLISVADGNTLVVSLRGAEMKVRMYGVVVPPADETRPILHRLNTESVAFLKTYLSEGWVYLEFPEGSAKPDADGYVPAYVYHGKDATFVNEKLLAEGLAIVNKKEKSAVTAKFATLQTGAKESMRGIWGSFFGGNGEKIASGGVPTAHYVGAGGAANDRRAYARTSYVSRWISSYGYDY